MVSVGNGVVCSKEAFEGNTNDFKEIWISKGSFWNSFISEFKVISYIEDMLFLEEEVTNYDPRPDTSYAPWLPEWASPTFGCLQRLNYVWKTYCKRCVKNRQTSHMLDYRCSQLEEYTLLAESMQKCSDLCVTPRSGVSMDYYPTFRYRCIISVFPWSMFLNKDFKAFLLGLMQAAIDFPPTVAVILFSNNRLWNGQLFWNKDYFMIALTTFLTNACATYISVHVSLTTKYLNIKNENLVKNDTLMFSNIITYLPFWSASAVDVHILCSNFLVYFTGETRFYYDHTKECSEDGFSTVETLYLQFNKAKEFEMIKSLLNLKFFCYEYSMYAEKLNATKKHLNNGGIQCIIQHITLCEYILLTLPQRVHYILSTLAPCYIHVHKIEKTKHSIELDTGLFVNVLSHLLNYHFKLSNSKAGCNSDYYMETFQTTVWDSLVLFRNFSDSRLLSEFCYPPWLEVSLKKESKLTFNLTPNSLKEALETFRIPLYETYIYFYFKILCCSPMSLSKQLLVNYQEILCLQNVTIIFATPILDHINKNVDSADCYDEESDGSISSLLFKNESIDSLPASSQLDSHFIRLRKLIFLIGIKILTFDDFFHSQVILGNFFLLFAEICIENVDHMKSLFFVKTFQPFISSFTFGNCCDINIIQPSAHLTLMYIWTSILVRLVDQQRIHNSLNALLECRLKDHVIDLFTVTDFVDNTPQANYKLLFKVISCFKNLTQDISLEKFYKNWHQILPRLTVDEMCIATIKLLCDVKKLTVAPIANQCLCELHSIFQNYGSLNTFYHILNETLYTIAYSTLSNVNQFNLEILIFCKSVLSLQDPYKVTGLDKDLIRRMDILCRTLSICDACLSLVESLPVAPCVRHFCYNRPMTFSNRGNESNKGKSICQGLPFLYPPWIEQHICHPLLFIRQLLYYFPILASDKYWDFVEKLYNQMQKSNKLENSCVTIKLCQVMALIDQGKIIQALVSFSKLSSALKSQKNPTVRSLKSIWTEHHCIHETFTCSAFPSSSLRYFSMEMVEEVRFHLMKLSLDLCSVLLETQIFHSLNDSLLQKIIKQVGTVFLESHFIQNYPINFSDKSTEVFYQNNVKAYSLLQSIKNLWERGNNRISSFNGEAYQTSSIYNDLLLYNMYHSPTITKKDLLMQPAVNAAKKTLQVLSSAATSMLLLPVPISSNIFSQNHIFDINSKDSRENINTSQQPAIDVFVTDMDYSLLSRPSNDDNSKTITSLQNSCYNTVYDDTCFLPQGRSIDEDHCIIIPDPRTKQATISENLAHLSNTQAVSNLFSDTVKLRQSPLLSSLTLQDQNEDQVEHIFQHVKPTSYGQEGPISTVQNQEKTNIPNHIAIKTEKKKIFFNNNNLSGNFRFPCMNANKIAKPQKKYSFSVPDVTAIKKKNSLDCLNASSVSSSESQDNFINDNFKTSPNVFSKGFGNRPLISDPHHILLQNNIKKHSKFRHFKKSYFQVTSYSDTEICSRKYLKRAQNTRNSLPPLTSKLCTRSHDTPNFYSPTLSIKMISKKSSYFNKKKIEPRTQRALKNRVFNCRKSDSFINNYNTKCYGKSFLDENRRQAMLQQFSDTGGFVNDIGDVQLSRSVGKTFPVIKRKPLSDTTGDQIKLHEISQTNGNIQLGYTENTEKAVQRPCNFSTKKKKKEMASHQLFNNNHLKSNVSICQEKEGNGTKTDKKCTEENDVEEHLPTHPDFCHSNNFNKINNLVQNTMSHVPFDHIRKHVENCECTKTSGVSDTEKNVRQITITSVPEFNKNTSEILQNQTSFISSTLHKKNTPLCQDVNQRESEFVNEVDAFKEIVNSLKREACSENEVTSPLLLPADKKNVTKSFDKTENSFKTLFGKECPDKPIPSNFLQSLTSAGKWIFSIPFYDAQDKLSQSGEINHNILSHPKNEKTYEPDEKKSSSFSSDFDSNDSIKLLEHEKKTKHSDNNVSPITPHLTDNALLENSGKIWENDLSSISSLNTFSSSSKSGKTSSKKNESLSMQDNDINGTDTHNLFQNVLDAPTRQIKAEDTSSKQSFGNNIDWDDEILSLGDSDNSLSSYLSNQLHSFTKQNSQSLNLLIDEKENLCSADSDTITNSRIDYNTKPINSVIMNKISNILNIDPLHNNLNAPKYLDPSLCSSESSTATLRFRKTSKSLCNEMCLYIYSERDLQKENEAYEIKTYKTQLTVDVFKDTTVQNNTRIMDTGRNSLLKKNSLSIFPSQNDFQDVNNVPYSCASKQCPHQIDDLQTTIYTNFSSMQDSTCIVSLLSNASRNTTCNHIFWNTNFKAIFNSLENKTSFNRSLTKSKSLPTINSSSQICKKIFEDIKPTDIHNQQSSKGKEYIVKYWKDEKNLPAASIQHAKITGDGNNDFDGHNPFLKNSSSHISKTRENNIKDSSKTSLKNSLNDFSQCIEEQCSANKVLSCIISSKKIFAANKDATSSPFHCQQPSLRDKNEKEPHYFKNNFSSFSFSTRLNTLFFGEKDSCNKNEEISSYWQLGQSLSQGCNPFNHLKKHNILIYCKTIFFDEETKSPRMESIFLVKHLKWFFKNDAHISTICDQSISLLRLEAYQLLYKQFRTRNYKVILSTSFKRLIGIKNKSGSVFLRLVLPGEYQQKYILRKTNLKNTRKISVFSKASALSIRNNATLTVWRNSVSFFFDFDQFLRVKNKLPICGAVKSVLENPTKSLFDDEKVEIFAKCAATPRCTNLFSHNKRNSNFYHQNTFLINQIKMSVLNKPLGSEHSNTFFTRMENMTPSENSLRCLTSSNNIMELNQSDNFSLNENSSGFDNNLVSSNSYTEVLNSKKNEKESVDDNVIPDDRLDTQMFMNPKVTVSQSISTLSLQFTKELSEQFTKYSGIKDNMVSQKSTICLNKLKVSDFDKGNPLTMLYTAPILTKKKPDSCKEERSLTDQPKSSLDNKNALNSLNVKVRPSQSQVLLLQKQDATCVATVESSLTHSKDLFEKKKKIDSIPQDPLHVNLLNACIKPNEKDPASCNKHDDLNDFSEIRQNEDADSELQKHYHSCQIVTESDHQPFLASTCSNNIFSKIEKRDTIRKPQSLKFNIDKESLILSQSTVLKKLKENSEADTFLLLTNGHRSLSVSSSSIAPNQINLENINSNTEFHKKPLTSYSAFTEIKTWNDENLSTSNLRKHVSFFTKKNNNVKKTDSSPIAKPPFPRHQINPDQRNNGDSVNNLISSTALNHFPLNIKHKEPLPKKNSLLCEIDQKIIDNWSDEPLSSCKTDDSDSINETFLKMTLCARSPMKPHISSFNKNNQSRSTERVTSLIRKKIHFGNKFDLHKTNKKNSFLQKNDVSLFDNLLSQTYNDKSISLKHCSMSHADQKIIHNWNDEFLLSSKSEDLNLASETSSSIIMYDRFDKSIYASSSPRKTADRSNESVIPPTQQKSPRTDKTNFSNIIKNNYLKNNMDLSNLYEMSPRTYNLKNFHHESSKTCKPNKKKIETWGDELVLSDFSESSESMTQESPILSEFNVAPMNQHPISVCEKGQHLPNGSFISPVKEQTTFFNVDESFEPIPQSFLEQQEPNNTAQNVASSINNSKKFSEKQFLASNHGSKTMQNTKNENILYMNSNDMNLSIRKSSTNHLCNVPTITSHGYPGNKENAKKSRKIMKVSVPNQSCTHKSKIIPEFNESNSVTCYANAAKSNKTILYRSFSEPLSPKRCSKDQVAETLVQPWMDDLLSSSFSEGSELISSKFSAINEHNVLPIDTHVSSTSRTNQNQSNKNVLSFIPKQSFSSNIKAAVKCKQNLFFGNPSNSIVTTEPISHTFIADNFLEKLPLNLEDEKIIQNWSDDLSLSNNSENTESSKTKSRDLNVQK